MPGLFQYAYWSRFGKRGYSGHDSDSIPRDRRPELEAAVVAAGGHLTKLFEGWIVASPDRRRLAVRITSYPELDISVPVDWNATAAEVTERVTRGDGGLTQPRAPRYPGLSFGYRGC